MSVSSPRAAAAPPAHQHQGQLGEWRVSWPVVVFAAVYVQCFARAQALLRDGDTFWHIAAGQWMLSTGRIPTTDPFSHTMGGVPWTAHEWLSEVLLAIAHDTGGWTWVVALTALAFSAAAAVLTRTLMRWVEPVYALAFAVVAVAMTGGHLLARPHVLAMPLLVLWTAALASARDEDRAPPIELALAMALWANLHASFTLGLGLAAMFAAEAVIEAKGERRGAVLTSWGIFLVLAAGAGMLTPQGPSGLWLPWTVMSTSDYAFTRIGEWRSPDFHSVQPLEVWILGGLAIALHRGVSLPPVRLIVLLALLHLALKHVRYIEWLGVVAPLIVAAPVATQRLARHPVPQWNAADRFFLQLRPGAGKGAVAVSVLLAAALPWWLSRAGTLQPPPSSAPMQAVDAALAAGVKAPVLNGYDWGGYLIYRGVPPFIDGRSEMYGDAFIARFAAAIDSSPGALEGILARYRIGWTLLPPDAPAVAVLDRLPGWRRLHTDGMAVVHVNTRP